MNETPSGRCRYCRTFRYTDPRQEAEHWLEDCPGRGGLTPPQRDWAAGFLREAREDWGRPMDVRRGALWLAHFKAADDMLAPLAGYLLDRYPDLVDVVRLDAVEDHPYARCLEDGGFLDGHVCACYPGFRCGACYVEQEDAA